MALLRQDDTREELRRRLIEEAEEFRRRHPVPDQEEVLAEMRRLRESLPKGVSRSDSVDLLREARGEWPEDWLERRIVQEAEEFQRRNPPAPDQKALLREILSRRSYRPADHGAPNSTALLREDRER
jgi:hypothetical protein